MYPGDGQRTALAQAFGCARVVYNDALRARETARSEGMPFPKAGDLSKRLITEAKDTPERAWLGEVSAVILQQSLRDLDTAYKNFFDGLKGKRPRVGAPRYKSRKDTRQSVRFTANARWSITPGRKLRLPKIGDVRVKWSRALPSVPSTVTVVKDSAGRYFASFVVETRVWTCGACGAVLDRDINAAVNAAKAAGLAVSACGARVRPGRVPAPRGEAGTHPTPQPSTAR
ncbi:RNA-guided endonuclease InsQ/TnpB family protein [Streptomyces sparsogenes]|uniref:RNA-guided endonuclease InsQ/TnpB family protein n=1 Tax=Streptomyces sparsogenes TaxID=67365 RepID=UPI003F4D38B7